MRNIVQYFCGPSVLLWSLSTSVVLQYFCGPSVLLRSLLNHILVRLLRLLVPLLRHPFLLHHGVTGDVGLYWRVAVVVLRHGDRVIASANKGCVVGIRPVLEAGDDDAEEEQAQGDEDLPHEENDEPVVGEIP